MNAQSALVIPNGSVRQGRHGCLNEESVKDREIFLLNPIRICKKFGGPDDICFSSSDICRVSEGIQRRQEMSPNLVHTSDEWTPWAARTPGIVSELAAA